MMERNKGTKMNAIRYAGVIAFLDWVRRFHPDVRSLNSLSEEHFLKLATEFEKSKGLMIDESHQVYMKWRTTHWVFSDSASDEAALQRLR
jgi:hypothetical protein